jgi:hypothetical protein
MPKNIPTLDQYAYIKLVLSWEKPSWLRFHTKANRCVFYFFKGTYSHQIHVILDAMSWGYYILNSRSLS